MREIKFRAWDKQEKKYLYQASEGGCSSEPYLSLDGKLMYGWTSEGGGGVEELNDDRYILEQYTGLKDKNKNGKEIYEGDIVKQERGDSFPKYNIGQVWYDSSRGRYLISYDKKIPANSFLRKLAIGGDIITTEDGNYMFGEITGWKIEIIGTIHDKEADNK